MKLQVQFTVEELAQTGEKSVEKLMRTDFLKYVFKN